MITRPDREWSTTVGSNKPSEVINVSKGNTIQPNLTAGSPVEATECFAPVGKSVSTGFAAA